MNKQNKITPEEKQLIIDLKKEGKSNNTIVALINNKVSPQRVSAIYNQHLLKVLQSK